MPDIIIVGVEGLRETKMTIPYEVLHEGLNVVKPTPVNARWWDDDDVDPDDVMPVETITCYDAGFAMKGRIVMAPREWIAKWVGGSPDLEPDRLAPSKVMDLDTDLTDDEFDLDDEDEELPKDWLVQLLDRFNW